MADVVDKAISANDVKNGGSLSTVDRIGNLQSLEDRSADGTNDFTHINAVMNDRMDNIPYYNVTS